MLTKTPLLILLLTLTLGLAPACSDDAEPGADKGPPVGDLYQATDSAQPDAPLPDAEPPCKEGDKRCDGLFKIERCQGGVWVPHEDCSQKKIGAQTCTCSMTLMYVCALGGSECT
jgi:hypothetical protein